MRTTGDDAVEAPGTLCLTLQPAHRQKPHDTVLTPLLALLYAGHMLAKYSLCQLAFQEHLQVFPDDSDGKESACSAGDLGSVPGSGRSPGEGNDYPLQYSCLENPWTEEL